MYEENAQEGGSFKKKKLLEFIIRKRTGRINREKNWSKIGAQFSRSVVSDSCDPMNRSMPGLPAHCLGSANYRIMLSILSSHKVNLNILPPPSV